MKYANIIIDNRSNSTDIPYTYAYEDGLDISIGSKVHVPFARSRNLREGYVISLQDEVDEGMRKKLKKISDVDGDVSLTEEIMRTVEWMRQRYVCRYIDAVMCFTPAGKKPSRSISPEPMDEEEAGACALTDEQKCVLERINTAIDKGEHSRFLLRGVTGSGKTEVYIRASKQALERGKKVIVLVPEISLTPQTVRRFTGVFPVERIAVLHSRMTAAQRYEQWRKIRSGEIDIVIGARSAIFAPLDDIGLIVVDEEHESTYKSDSTPKYDAVEVALKRASDESHGAVLLLGSATPSVASSYRATQGIYEPLLMEKRYNETPLPHVEVVDMRRELRDGNTSILSNRLYDEMERTLENDKQVLLFLNRRGYSTFISCRDCGYVAKCPVCGLSLTYHSSGEVLSCHYCGHEEPLPKVCPECHSRYIRHFGSGTEKLEKYITDAFTDHKVDRIDLDSVRRKGELRKKLVAFEKGSTSILVGTQMIAKGLDFRNIGLVGIISADVTLNIPDYRSAERTFQLITQAAGRAGRGSDKGRVVIQTYSPEHYSIIHASRQDYEGFYEAEIDFRRVMRYPPFADMIQILFTSKDQKSAQRGAILWYEAIRENLPEKYRKDVFMPQEAYMGRIRDIYRYSLVMRCEAGRRRQYADIFRRIREEDIRRKTDWTAVVDINPYSFA